MDDQSDAISYAVTAEVPNDGTRREYVSWLCGGHIQEVVRAGATRAEVIALDSESGRAGTATFRVESRYIFPTRQALDAYIRDHAPRLRAEGVAKFGDRGVTFTRRIGPVVLALSTQLSTQGERV